MLPARKAATATAIALRLKRFISAQVLINFNVRGLVPRKVTDFSLLVQEQSAASSAKALLFMLLMLAQAEKPVHEFGRKVLSLQNENFKCNMVMPAPGAGRAL